MKLQNVQNLQDEMDLLEEQRRRIAEEIAAIDKKIAIKRRKIANANRKKSEFLNLFPFSPLFFFLFLVFVSYYFFEKPFPNKADLSVTSSGDVSPLAHEIADRIMLGDAEEDAAEDTSDEDV